MTVSCINLAILFYFVTLVTVVTKSNPRFIRFFSYAGLGIHALGLVIRAWQYRQPPFTSIYEVVVLLMLFVIARWIWQGFSNPPLIRAAILFFVIITLTTLQFLPPVIRSVRPLPPALKSAWVYLHIPAYLFGYMALFFACFYSFQILLSARSDNSPEIIDLGRKLNRETRLALFGLNLGLISGAIWAFDSWGNYWSWDPKEVWALINIFFLSGYFHLVKPRNYKKALIIVGAVVSVLFTLIGVTYLLSGLHSYR